MSDLLLTIAYLALVFFGVYRLNFFRLPGLPRYSALFALALKLLAGLVLVWYYAGDHMDRKDADIYVLYDDSEHMYEALWSEPGDFFSMVTGIGLEPIDYYKAEYFDQMNRWLPHDKGGLFNDAHFMIRLNALLRLISGGVYGVHVILMCLFSLVGLVAFYKTFQPHLRDKERLWGAVLFLLPSLLFWTSGILKEGLLVFALGSALYCLPLFRGSRRFTPLSGGWFLAAFVLMVFLKLYSFVILLGALLPFLWCRWMKDRLPLLNFFGGLGVLVLVCLSVQWLVPRLDLLGLIREQQRAFIELARVEDPDSLIPLTRLDNAYVTLLEVLPEALVNTFLRPLPGNLDALLYWPPFLENVFMLTSMLVCITLSKPIYRIDVPMLLFGLTVVLGFYSLIGLTTPILGAILRYKVPALPFLFLAFFLILDAEKGRRTLKGMGLMPKTWDGSSMH